MSTPKRKRRNDLENELKEDETPSKRKRLYDNWSIFEGKKEENVIIGGIQRKKEISMKKETTGNIREMKKMYEENADRKAGIDGEEKENGGEGRKKEK